jgi:hypothetical protein
MKKVLLVASLAVISAASQAITFTFVNFGGDPAMYAGMSASSLVFSGNSMTVTPSNAAVGDPVAGSRSRRFSITYKIDAGAGKFITSMNGSFISAIAGANSSITMVESLVKLDAAGNEVGAAFATLTGSTNLSSQTFTGSVSFAPVRALIVKKDFFLVRSAPLTSRLKSFLNQLPCLHSLEQPQWLRDDARTASSSKPAFHLGIQDMP